MVFRIGLTIFHSKNYLALIIAQIYTNNINYHEPLQLNIPGLKTEILDNGSEYKNAICKQVSEIESPNAVTYLVFLFTDLVAAEQPGGRGWEGAEGIPLRDVRDVLQSEVAPQEALENPHQGAALQVSDSGAPPYLPLWLLLLVQKIS